jgi:DNA invertase Pin-like site-specific DNA recombinase
MKQWNVAIYARVSSEKEEQKDSVPAQIQSLKEWLLNKSREDREAIYALIKVYEDVGKSGSNFERESFAGMMEDVEKGLINMVITRDLSRFGRNYIQAGYYLEDYFKVNGVRFISVLDQVDTVDEISDIVPFKNILNEMFIKDCSRRCKDGLRQRMKRGSFIGSRAPYGYKTVSSECNGQKNIELVAANDETTETVRIIFDLYLEGWGYGRISNYLTAQGIDPPGKSMNHFKMKYNRWTENGIKCILQNPKYAGRMIQGQYRKISYKIDKTVKNDEKDWVYGGEFDGIIPTEVFDQVQEKLKKRGKGLRYKGDVIHLFSGVLKCGDCNSSMGYRVKYKGYMCLQSQKGGKRCTTHSVKEQRLSEIVKGDLIRFADTIDKNTLLEKNKDLLHKDNEEISRRIKVIESELTKLDNKFHKLYDDRLDERISVRNFEIYSAEIQAKQSKLQRERENLQGSLVNVKDIEREYQRFREYIEDALSFEHLTRRNIEDLIDVITIFEDKETRQKRIEIKYKFRYPIAEQ